MSNLVPIMLSPSIYQKLQKLAVLAGSESAAVERLITHWQTTEAIDTVRQEVSKPAVPVWRSTSGDVLRIGERLEAKDGGKTHYATVEHGGIQYAGQVYDSPSAAAKAVKEKRGLVGVSTNTNGRAFWKLRDPGTNRLVPLSALRPVHKIDSDALLAELDALPSR